jgi:hippurate hydrolase
MTGMNIDTNIEKDYEYFKSVRQHLHTIPELGFEEFETSKFIMNELERLGIEYESGIAKTGIIAWIKSGNSDKAIAFRADFDALELQEETDISYCSKNKGKMHACGHDGHVAILLAFAKAVKEHKNKFDGTVYLIFQPAEEGLGGAKAMLDDNLLQRYKIDKIFSIHNRPTEDFGKIFVKMGTMMASYDNYKIIIHGKSTHSSMPQTGKNPIVAAAHIVTALKSITSLDLSPMAKSVVTVAKISGGSDALNIVPNKCEIAGSIRAYEKSVRDDIELRVKEIAQNLSKAFGMEAEVLYHQGYPPTVNSDINSALLSAKKVVGEENVVQEFEASFGAEDFSYFLNEIPGCYVWLGAREKDQDTIPLHNTNFDFNDELIKVGATYFLNIVFEEL